jgi:hypothetical protein
MKPELKEDSSGEFKRFLKHLNRVVKRQKTQGD